MSVVRSFVVGFVGSAIVSTLAVGGFMVGAISEHVVSHGYHVHWHRHGEGK